MNENWSYSIPGAQKLLVKFSADSRLESSFDKLYITDKDGNAIQSSYWTGTMLANARIIVNGDTLNLRMTTDGSVQYYGFKIDLIAPLSN